MKIGFIGLGNMGAPMALNLLKAGHSVAGFDKAGVTVPGLEMGASVVAVAAGRDVVVTMLPNGDIVRQVAKDVLAASPKPACLIDCSTIDVDTARAVDDLARQVGVHSVDAPVSGGIGGATAGTLTFMVGGNTEAVAKSEPVLMAMGKKVVYCGAAGAGQAAKICNNMLLGISMIGVCEAFNLADGLQLDRQKLFDVVSASSGACWSMNTYCPAPGVGPTSPADNGYKPGFAAELMLKDLLLAQQAARTTGTVTPLGAEAAALYRDFVASEGAGHDFSAMVLRLAKLSRDTAKGGQA